MGMPSPMKAKPPNCRRKRRSSNKCAGAGGLAWEASDFALTGAGVELTKPCFLENICMEPPWPRQMPVFLPKSSAMISRAGTFLLRA